MKKTALKLDLYPILIGLLAFALRLWNTYSVGNDFYASFLSDASTYRVWASKLATGVSYGEPIFQMGPLYPYFLALQLKLGLGFFSILILQGLMGALVTVLVYYMAKMIFGRAAGIISGLLTAIYAPFIFYDGLILSESIQIFLLVLGLLFLLLQFKKPGRFNFLISGIFIGLTALGRATILFFPMALGIYWLVGYYIERSKGKIRPWPKMLLLFAGVIIGILPATLHNMSYGDLTPISSNTGINFYIGNNINSPGAYEEPPGLNLSTDFTGRRVAEKEAGRPLKSSQVSSFWMSKTMSDIKHAPGHFISGLFKKTWLYLWYYDISQAESLEIQREFSPLFKLPLAGFGLIMVFGLMGALYGRIDENRWILILLFVSNLVGVILFFVIGRFKLLGSLALLIAAGNGILMVIQFITRRQWQKLMVFVGVAIFLVLVLYLPRSLDKKEKLASAYDNVGIYYYFKNQPDQSIQWYRKASAVLPEYSASLNNIGTYFYSKGQLDSAQFYFHKSLLIDTTEDKTLMNLGRIAMDKGNIDSAKYYYLWAKRVSPFGTSPDEALKEIEQHKPASAAGDSTMGGGSFETLFGAAEQLASRGQFDQAEKLYIGALKIKKDDIKALNNLGFAYQAQKKYIEAAQCFDKVLKLSPDNGVLYNNLAGTLYQMGMIDSAEVLWNKAIKLDPTNPQIKTNLDYVRKLRGK
jgi:tetratricopeptide (TPR) repeat protein